MKEYKRQKKEFEERVFDYQKKCQHHDDHLRVIDAWFSQLLDEVRVLAQQSLPAPSDSGASEMYQSALLFESSEAFSNHLQTRADVIKTSVTELFSRLPSSSPDMEEVRRQLNAVLAREKELTIDLRRTLDDKESISERLEQASYRYMTAEKKLDRAKSSQVQKLERAAIMGNGDSSTLASTKKAGTPKKEDGGNGELGNGVASTEVEAARKEAEAVVATQKAQLSELEAENERLTTSLSAVRTRLANLNDSDYADTALFKMLKSKYEDVVATANNLQATSEKLREDYQKLQAERNAYRTTVDEEHRASAAEIEAQVARAESDLARIRAQRDDLTSELTVRKSADETSQTAIEHAKTLATARDSRITSLESQVERLLLQLGESAPPEADIDDLDLDALKSKLRTLQGQYSLLSNELPSMEAAWKKTQSLASKKSTRSRIGKTKSHV